MRSARDARTGTIEELGIKPLARLWRNDTLQALSALSALTLVLLGPAATLQGVYFYGDANDYFSRLAYSATRLRMGQLPLWNPYLSLGGSHAGDPAALTWYVPALALFLMLPEVAAYNYTVILHLLWAAIGMYLLARAWHLSHSGALLAGMVYAFNGFLIAHLQHLNIVVGAAWLPWIFLCIEELLETGRVRWLVLGGFAFALQILGGHTQIVLYGAVAWAAYALVRLSRIWREGDHRRACRLGLGLGGMVLGGLGLAAIFLVPLVELLHFTARNERVSYEFATSFSLEPLRLLTLVYPYLFGGNPGSIERGPGSLIEMSAYIGLVPLVLAALAPTQSRDVSPTLPYWRVSFLAILALVALALALGKFNPLYPFVYQLPLLGAVRAPARFLLGFVFAAALLAGYGMERLQRAPRLYHRLCLVFLVLLLLGEGVFFLFPHLGITLSETLAQGAKNPALRGTMILTVLASGIIILWWRQFLSPQMRVAVTLAIVFLDLFYFGWNFRYNFVVASDIYTIPGANARVLGETPQSLVYYWGLGETKPASYLQRGALDEYVRVAREGLRQSLPLRFGVRSMQGYGSEPPVYAELMRALEARGNFDAVSAALTARYGNTFVLSTQPLENEQLELVQRAGAVRLYRNLLGASVGRVRIVGEAQFLPNATMVVEALTKEILPGNRVLLEGSDSASDAAMTSASPHGHAVIETDIPEYIAIRASTDQSGWLVLNDTFYPGWRARIDGQPVAILRADAWVRAVRIEPGAHLVEFIYDPDSVKQGMLLSTLSLLIGLVVLGFHAYKPLASHYATCARLSTRVRRPPHARNKIVLEIV